MDLREFTRALRRRWYVALVVFALAGATGWGMMQVVAPRYSAVATAVLIPPKSTVENAAQLSRYAPPNPLLYLGGLSQSRDLVLRKLADRQVVEAVESAVPGADFDAAPDVTSSGPIVVVTARAGSPDGALAAMQVLEGMMQSSLKEIQQDLHIADANRITMLTLTADTQATVERKQQFQFAVLSSGVALVGGLLLLGALDSLLEARRGRLGRGRAGQSRPPVEQAQDSKPPRALPASDDEPVDGEIDETERDDVRPLVPAGEPAFHSRGEAH